MEHDVGHMTDKRTLIHPQFVFVCVLLGVFSLFVCVKVMFLLVFADIDDLDMLMQAKPVA